MRWASVSSTAANFRKPSSRTLDWYLGPRGAGWVHCSSELPYSKSGVLTRNVFGCTRTPGTIRRQFTSTSEQAFACTPSVKSPPAHFDLPVCPAAPADQEGNTVRKMTRRGSSHRSRWFTSASGAAVLVTGLIVLRPSFGAEDSSHASERNFSLQQGHGLPICEAYLELLNQTKFTVTPF